MAPFGISHTSSYSYFIVNIYLLPLLRYSASNIGVTLKSGSGVVQDHSKWGSDPNRPTGGYLRWIFSWGHLREVSPFTIQTT